MKKANLSIIESLGYFVYFFQEADRTWGERMIGRILVLLVTLMIWSCVSPNRRGPAAEGSRPRHFVITVHGVRGNEMSFGALPTILPNTLSEIDPRFEVIPVNWTYPVGKERDKELDPHGIAKKLNKDHFLNPDSVFHDFKDEDKISIIGYSMGGLMTMTWYYDTMFNYAQYPPGKQARLERFLERVENVVGLAPVYWGSMDAELGWSLFKDGDLTELRKTIAQLDIVCKDKKFKDSLGNPNFVKDTLALVKSLKSFRRPLEKENQGELIASLTQKICLSSKALNQGNLFLAALGNKHIKPAAKTFIESALKLTGNVHPNELEDMSLTGDTINLNRIRRIDHYANPQLKDRFKARWQSIVGVFPCLGEAEDSVACSKFVDPRYKSLNDALVVIFSGVRRRESDGPVITPSAVADFLFYTEGEGNEKKAVSSNNFWNTRQLASPTGNEDIFVENQHASASPALDALGFFGQGLNAKLLNFDKSLGVDIVLVEPNCNKAETCEHPNYRHILKALSHCDSTKQTCSQEKLGPFYGDRSQSDWLQESNELKSQLGGYVLNFNIRLPKSFTAKDESAAALLNYFKIKEMWDDPKAGAFGESRLDLASDKFIHQLGRKSEILSRYATLTTYGNSKILRAFFIGRVFPKQASDSETRKALDQGVNVDFAINIPGVTPRSVQAKVVPAMTTYIDIHMK